MSVKRSCRRRAARSPDVGAARPGSTSRATTTCSCAWPAAARPVPGDDIIGFVTRGRGVSVHRTDCANASSLAGAQAERIIDVDWDTDAAGHFVALVEIKALDRPRLLQEVTATLSDNHVNILSQPEPLRTRPGVQDALRVRARRPVAPRHAAEPAPHDRQRVRRLPGGAGRHSAPPTPAIAGDAARQQLD